MITGKQILKWATGRQTPPWRITELRSALKADPQKPFLLSQAITAVENETCVVICGVRDAVFFNTPEKFAQFQAIWNSSVPSRGALVALINLLSANGSSLKYLSNDWKTLAIMSSPGKLSSLLGLSAEVTGGFPAQLKQAGENDIIIGEGLNAAGAPPIVGEAFILGGAIGVGVASALDWLSSSTEDNPATTQGSVDGFGSSAGGDNPGSIGDNVLVVPGITIVGAYTGDQVDPAAVVDGPVLDLGTIPDAPASGDSDGNGDGTGDSSGG